MARGHNGEGSIYPYRNGFAAYVWIVTPDGRRQRKYVYGKSRQAVHEKWLAMTAASRRGPVAPTHPRLSEYIERWLNESVRPNLAPQTVANYEFFSRAYISGRLLRRETKTAASDRALPLPEICVRALEGRLELERRLRSQAEAWHESGLVITTNLASRSILATSTAFSRPGVEGLACLRRRCMPRARPAHLCSSPLMSTRGWPCRYCATARSR